MEIGVLLTLSVVFQFVAAALALRLVRATGGGVAWALIAAAATLMGVRRLITLYRLLSGHLDLPPDPSAEVVALVISILMVVGVALIGPLFTRLREHEATLATVNRALRTLSACNQVLVRATREEELLREVCQVIVEVGGYRMVWVGYAEDDEAKSVRPMAHAGHEEGYIDTLDITWADTERGRGPTGTAIRTGTPQVSRQIGTDQQFRPWRKEAAQRGYRSSVALPLITEDRVLGALNVYAAEPDAFGPEEVRLLGEMADDLAFGITTIRTRAERVQAEERLHSVMEAAPDGIVAVNERGEIVFVNSRTEQLFGYERDELLGRTIEDLIPVDLRRKHAEHRTRYAARPRARLMGVGLELRAQRKDGTQIPVEVSLSPTSGGNGTLVVASVRDIGERLRLEEIARQSEASYRGLVEHATYGIYRSSPRGTFLTVNPAMVEMLGYESDEELLKLDMARDIYKDPEERRRLLERYRTAETIDSVEVQWKRKDDKVITVRLSGRAVHNDQGELAYFDMIAEDLTERKQLEAQLRQAQKMEAIGQLTGGIAHDFNNILTVILSNTELVAGALPSDQTDLLEDVAEIRAAATRGASLVRGLMGFSRQERLELKPTDLAQLVAEMSTMLQRLLPENIEIWVVTDRPVPTVMVDPHAVEQIILNTATNSRDAMPEGGLLKIQIYKSWLDEDYCVLRPGCEPGEYVCIAVSDTGIGMDEETKEHIFEPFFTTKQRGEGTGLGMSMLYGLITQHGGSVDVYSKPGEGTTVRMCFPAVKEPPSDRVPRKRMSELPGGTETILVVEDDMAIRRATVRTLEGHGYRVLAAADGEEGLELFRAHESEIALVLTDIVMPKLGGRELYEALKGEGKRVNVMFVSGYSSKDVVESKVLPSEVPLLNKPWTIPDLLARVREVLDRQVSV